MKIKFIIILLGPMFCYGQFIRTQAIDNLFDLKQDTVYDTLPIFMRDLITDREKEECKCYTKDKKRTYEFEQIDSCVKTVRLNNIRIGANYLPSEESIIAFYKRKGINWIKTSYNTEVGEEFIVEEIVSLKNNFSAIMSYYELTDPKPPHKKKHIYVYYYNMALKK